jgi:5'-nucleotidase
VTHILLTNDDGIEAPGLRALLPALSSLAQLTVFAPDHNWSAAGHTKTLHKPLRVTPYQLADGVQAYTSSGAPSDCVALALLGILPQKPDLVVSGTNQGANVGHDLIYSGTVAAAREAVISGLPAISISLDSYDNPNFAFAAKVAAQVVRQVQQHGLPAGTFLNVNVPSLPPEEIAGIAITRLSRLVYREVLVRRHDPRGRPYYWIGGEPPSGHQDQGTDIWALAHGYVSITPVHLDMTAHEIIPELQNWELGV